MFELVFVLFGNKNLKVFWKSENKNIYFMRVVVA